MAIYISNSSCISAQDFSSEKINLEPLSQMESPSMVEPSYKTLLKPALLRRMSKVLKMGNYCAKDVLTNEAGEVHQPDAIIVGTGLGCVRDTLGFLEEVIKNNEQTLAPTAFIQSTHNSIAGQIALMLQNYRYNMTVVQKSISFEMSLIDAELQLSTASAESVLVGAADEMTDGLSNLLEELAKSYNTDLPALGEGAAFFSLSSISSRDTIAEIEKVVCKSQGSTMESFLAENEISLTDYDLILNGSSSFQPDVSVPSIAYKDYCGEYFTSSAFAMHIALQFFNERIEAAKTTSPKRILILNNFAGQFGAISLKKFEL